MSGGGRIDRPTELLPTAPYRTVPSHALDGSDVDEPAVGVGGLGLVRRAGARGKHVSIRLTDRHQAHNSSSSNHARRNQDFHPIKDSKLSLLTIGGTSDEKNVDD